MSKRSMSALVVATGTGEPMRSQRPKPIHLLCGRAMTSYVLDSLDSAGVRQGVIVTGAEGGRISKRLLEDSPSFPLRFVEQKSERGIGDAVLAGLSGFDDFEDDEDLLIVPGDLPLLRPELLTELVAHHRDSGSACTALATLPNEEGAGELIIRNRHGRVSAVASSSAIDGPKVGEGSIGPEVAVGVYCVRRGMVAPAVRRSATETRGPVPLSAMVSVLAESGHHCDALIVENTPDLSPVDNRLQLAEAEAGLRRRTNERWLSMGVTMVDPDRTYIDATVSLGTDVTIFPGTILQGSTRIGDGCELGPDVRLDRCEIGRNTRIEKTTATLATVGDDCVVGPFAVLAPGTSIGAGSVTGPFYAGG